MLVTDVKSRPQYQQLRFDASGRFHLFVGQGEGGLALLRVRSELPDSEGIRVIYTGESHTGSELSEELASCRWRHLTLLPTQVAALQVLDEVLAQSLIGTRLYVAGSEGFIGLAEQVAARYDLQSDELQREHLGSSARRVFCVHCQTSHDDVTTNIVPCRGCGRHLLVRDHYSRRLAAFMGVMADAEVPGCFPELTEGFAPFAATNKTFNTPIPAIEPHIPARVESR
ncbi:MAG: hypothetical protein JWM11_4848 [Planctomycetaceae bacterium]|nr:hypothetical protein [Planctomycetaceae bacterium]